MVKIAKNQSTDTKDFAQMKVVLFFPFF